MATPDLTERDREILALAIELCDRREIAVILNKGHVTVGNHFTRICERLNLPTRYIRFSSLEMGQEFVHKGITSKRVPRSTDRYGGYNAEDASGHRRLVLYHTIVEQVK